MVKHIVETREKALTDGDEEHRKSFTRALWREHHDKHRHEGWMTASLNLTVARVGEALGVQIYQGFAAHYVGDDTLTVGSTKDQLLQMLAIERALKIRKDNGD